MVMWHREEGERVTCRRVEGLDQGSVKIMVVVQSETEEKPYTTNGGSTPGSIYK